MRVFFHQVLFTIRVHQPVLHVAHVLAQDMCLHSTVVQDPTPFSLEPLVQQKVVTLPSDKPVGTEKLIRSQKSL